MVKLLFCVGHLHEAQNFINKMTMKQMVIVWVYLLDSCKMHTNIKVGEHASQYIFELDPNNTIPYVLMEDKIYTCMIKIRVDNKYVETIWHKGD